MKWVPKAIILAPPSSIPIIPVVSDVLAILEVPSPIEEKISWRHEVNTCIHNDLEMRYDPKVDSYHMWDGENEESTCLFYHVDGDGLTLTKGGNISLGNWQLLLDAS